MCQKTVFVDFNNHHFARYDSVLYLWVSNLIESCFHRSIRMCLNFPADVSDICTWKKYTSIVPSIENRQTTTDEMIGVFKEQSSWGGVCARNFGVHLGRGGARKIPKSSDPPKAVNNDWSLTMDDNHYYQLYPSTQPASHPLIQHPTSQQYIHLSTHLSTHQSSQPASQPYIRASSLAFSQPSIQLSIRPFNLPNFHSLKNLFIPSVIIHLAT